jgi:ribosomal protein S18 acetylase RimI-like enzyme
MIIRGPEQPDQSAIENLFTALLTAGNQHVLPSYLLNQQNPSQLTHALYTSRQSKKDLHRFGFTRGQAVVYGCLSSWEDTLRSPQLSLAVHPSFRNRGFAHAMCCQLHDLARIRGARSVRALISKENHYAIALCRSFGYKMTPTTDSHLHGSLELQSTGDEHNRWVA